MTEHTIKIPALEARIYQTSKGKYSVQLGGFYNIHAPLEEAIDKAEEQLKRVTSRHIQRQINGLKRRLKREQKSKTIRR
jgi:hypothetical protein